MTKTVKIASIGSVVLLAATIAFAANLKKDPLALSTVFYKSRSSASGHATATLEVIATAPEPGSALGVFRLTVINPDNGMLCAVRREIMLADVAWPVTLTMDKAEGIAATATFDNPGLAPNDVQITTTDG